MFYFIFFFFYIQISTQFQNKKLEGKFDEDNLSKYNSVENELDKIYDYITEATRIRSKCDWYEYDEKSTKFFD